MVSKASEDFPEPDSPVNTTSLSRGISTSIFFRLCSRAPRMVIARWLDGVCWRRAFRTSSISAFPALFAQALGAPRRKGRSDATGSARNVGRTGRYFQCSVQAINKAAGLWQQPAAAENKKAGTRPASFLVSATVWRDQYF